jgi:hypothetical protein
MLAQPGPKSVEAPDADAVGDPAADVVAPVVDAGVFPDELFELLQDVTASTADRAAVERARLRRSMRQDLS